MILKSLEVSCGVSLKCSSYDLLLLSWAPEVPDVCSFTLLHVVNSRIDCFFLCDEPFVDLERTDLVILRVSIIVDLVDLYKVVP